MAKPRVLGRATHQVGALKWVLLRQPLEKLRITELRIDIDDKAS